jgi:hypothetical protein
MVMPQITPLLAVVLLFFSQSQSAVSRGVSSEAKRAGSRQQQSSRDGYVGSKTCAPCHRKIYNSYLQTGMGRAMSAVTPAVLKEIPNSALLFNERLNRHFSVLVRSGRLYQSEWETGEDGKEVFRKTERIEWIIGSGANALGGLTRRGNQVLEAPLTFYVKTRAWAFSPGYDDADRGFNRPIEAECILCHSGRANPVSGAPGQFHNPAFDELAIGCENCHGPGAAHVREIRDGAPKVRNSSHSIVNPAKLSPWLADNICMLCHQNGARVLQPGKSIRDFRPAEPLDRTLAILMSPPTRESPPDSDHVQHYFSMTLSKCYRGSSPKLSCIACHDPHVQPSHAEAPQYFRKKCLGCHADKSCKASLDMRRQSKDNCIGCHMPKRDVTVISHAILTNHRIVAAPDEPFPDITFQLATTQLPDLVHLNAAPDEPDTTPPLLTLLQAYGQLGVQRREYLQRYFEVAEQLENSEPNNIHVLEALASRSLQLRTVEGDDAAMEYLKRAIEQGSTSAWDFEQLGGRFLREGKFSEALAWLREGIRRAPYDATLYALLANAYMNLNQPAEATATLRQASQLFPQMDILRQLLQEVEQSASSEQGTGQN